MLILFIHNNCLDVEGDVTSKKPFVLPTQANDIIIYSISQA